MTSNVEAGPAPDPVYTKTFTDAVSGPPSGPGPVTVSGTSADCLPGAQCFIAPSNTLFNPVDVYFHDVYERPAGRGTAASTYYPGIDIVSTQVGLTPNWVYYRINLNGSPTGTSYAFEINYDNDLRGDAFVHLISPLTGVGSTWGRVGLRVSDDQNNNMGGYFPIFAEGPGNGASYEHTQFNQGANPSGVGGQTAAQARVVGSSIEFAIYRPFLAVLQGAISKAAFRPYASQAEIKGGDLYVHDRGNRSQVGSPYPWLQLSGAPGSCPGGSHGDFGNSPLEILALDSGTRTPTAHPNPCYAESGPYEFDNAGTVSDFAFKTDGELQFFCGNGTIEIGEVCDDGNSNQTDGCANCALAICGDGFVRAGTEQCDDGNSDDTDGCTSTCTITVCGDGIKATSEPCDDGNTVDTDDCRNGCILPICGDGVVRAGIENCDDGNQVDTDACRNNCTAATCGDGVVGPSEMCDDGNQVNTDACIDTCVPASCGDTFIGPGEACDDGNADNTDACLDTCAVASCGDGHVRTGSEDCDDGNGSNTDACLNTCLAASCGDMFVGPNETCDDGNLVNTDACPTTCFTAVCGDGYTQAGIEMCDDGNASNTDVCLTTCVPATCGDGHTRAGVEECDDANAVNTDSCVTGCLAATCGDMFVRAGVETCDDGNLVDTDACRNTCTTAACGDGVVGPGETCDDNNLDNTDACANCVPARCGDGFVQGGGVEACDDADTDNTDACTNTCTVAVCGDGFTQTGVEDCDDANSITTDDCISCVAATCGDGIVHAGVEGCDDANANNSDLCTNACTLPSCGDGFVQAGEACDDGNADNTDACTTACVAPACGDGFVQSGEACDDGNASNTDACRNGCILATCGDGFVRFGIETCDDANASNTDACLTTCVAAGCGDGFVRAGVETCDDANAVNTDACPMTCAVATCGDGFVQAGVDACDDGNLVASDGCENTCRLSTGQPCTMDPQCASGVCDETGSMTCEPANACGNGTVEAGEICDDGNMANGDGCESSCRLTIGQPCTTSPQCDSNVCDPTSMTCEPANMCGNGTVEGSEICDDGNTVNGDGCESSCLRTNGQPCTTSPQCDSGQCDTTTTPGICEPAVGCGNGLKQPGEGCDDGNTTNGDGCSAACDIENGFPCNQTPPGDVDDASCQSGVCDTTGGQPGMCEPAQSCGNSVREGAEICDDGNVTNGDGCESTCKLSLGEPCTMDGQCQSGECDEVGSMTCEPAIGCGNGTLNAGEGCDDGGNVAGDGCNATCDIENTFPCNATPPGDIGNPSCESTICDQSGSAQGTCEPASTCGNNRLEAGEGCDDGGTVAGDGCNAACKIEDGDPCNADTAGATGDASCASDACNDSGGAPGVCGGSDTDGDGVFDFDDIDDDNDGLLDSEEGFGARDTDGDAAMDSVDLDSDNDGIPDATEARHRFPDRNGDYLADCPGSVGTNGLCDALETTPDSGTVVVADALLADTDDDSVSDYRDLDSDNDGLSDLVEAVTFRDGCTDANNNGVCDGPDADGDGIAPSIDLKPAAFGTMNARLAVDDDSDQLEDYRDLDSDNDGIRDIIESKNAALDANLDGVIDATGDKDSDGIRDVADDSDLDGTPDSADLDPASFGGLLDTEIDTDSDQDPDQRDTDSDEDTVGDGPDTCRLISNPVQDDIDGDGTGDECDDSDDRWGLQGGGCGCGTTGQPGSMVVLGLAVLWTLGRRRRRRSAGAIAGWVVLGLLAVPTPSHAQQVVPGDFSTERFQLSTDSDGLLDVESAAVRKHLALDMALWLGYANDPLTLNRPGADHARQGSLVSNQVGGELVAAIGLFGRAQVAIAVPLVLLQDDDLSGGDPTMPTAPQSSFAIGDLRLIPKWQLLRQRDHEIDLALVIALTFPTSSGEGFAGDTSVTATPMVAVSRAFGQGMRGGLNLGYRVREQRMAIDLEINDELFAGLGLGYDLSARGGPPLELDVGFAYATAANDAFGTFNRNYAEVKAGASYNLNGPLLAFAAFGVGVAEGYGTPDWRMLAGIRVDRTPEDAPPPPPIPDTDMDGYKDPVDKCPTDPEDFDKFEDEDGCPDLDDDKDTIPDKTDECRLEPEDLDGFEDANGCPELDNDGDKILDTNDKCPLEAEDLDSFQDEDGCPELDNDADTVPDTADGCPLIAGPVDNKGCPWPDRDGDTVIDRFDNCPDEPGKVERQGCNAKQLVKITATKLELLETVFFQTNKAKIQRRSYKLLDNVATVIKSHPDLKIKIDGHTDDRGSDAFNLKLSQSRAAAAVTYLVKKGVEATRLSSEGFGEQYPIEENDRAQGRAANRRVEFMIVGTVETTVAPPTPATPAPAPTVPATVPPATK